MRHREKRNSSARRGREIQQQGVRDRRSSSWGMKEGAAAGASWREKQERGLRASSSRLKREEQHRDEGRSSSGRSSGKKTAARGGVEGQQGHGGRRQHGRRARDGSDTAGPLSGGLREVDVVQMDGWVAEKNGDAGCGGVVELVALMVGWRAATPAWPWRRPEVEKEG